MLPRSAPDPESEDEATVAPQFVLITEREEREWVVGIRGGDERAFEALFRAYAAPLVAFVTGYVHAPDVAEELVQDVLCSIWERRTEWTVRDGVRSYLYLAARNRAFKYLKHERVVRKTAARQTHGPVPGMGVVPANGDERTREREIAERVAEAIAGLPARAREAYILRRDHGLSYAEIARVMGITAKGVDMALSRATRQLREQLADLL
jgi:RNA polymerase sigma-70 factor (ECF subfamily)